MRRPSSPIHDVQGAFDVLRIQGHTLPRRLPSILPGSLRPHHRPDKVWVYDEANREWTAAASPEPRRSLFQRLRRGSDPMWWRSAELRIERALRARFN
jgi:hypothetical protein